MSRRHTRLAQAALELFGNGDEISPMRWLICLLLTLLCGCSVFRQKVEMDAAGAAAIANAAGDTAGAACFAALGPIVSGSPTGLLSKFELVRAGQIVLEDGPCAPLTAGLALHLLNKLPGTP